MSIILEALKRAEEERGRPLAHEGFRYLLPAAGPWRRRRRLGAVVLSALLVGAGAGTWSAKTPWGGKGGEADAPGRSDGAARDAAVAPADRPSLSVPANVAAAKSSPSKGGGPTAAADSAEAPPAGSAAREFAPKPSASAEDRPTLPERSGQSGKGQASAPAGVAPPAPRPPQAPAAAASSPGAPRRVAKFSEPLLETAGGWILRAQRLESEGEWERARAAYERALEEGSASADARIGLGALAERRGRMRDAIAHYIGAARLRPADARPHTALGRLYASKGDYLLAMNEYHLAMRNAPDDPGPAYGLSVLYARLGRASSALRYLREAVSKDARLRERARRESAFSAIRDEPAFRALFGAGGEMPRP